MSIKQISPKLILIAVVIVAASFYIGLKVGGGSTTTMATPSVTGQSRSMNRGFQGGATNGVVVTKDATSATIQLKDGSSKIVLFSDGTSIVKSTLASSSDLIAGEQVMVMGSTNQDGSISAQSIQIRPTDQNIQ